MSTIRRATEQDIDRCDIMLKHAKDYLREQDLTQWDWGYPNRLNIETDIERGDLYVMCDDDGELMGSVAVVMDGEPNYFTHPLRGVWLTNSPDDEDATYACIHRVITAPEFRGCGVATALMQECERLARAAHKRSCRVETHERNMSMRHIAEKLGYIHCCDVVTLHDQVDGRVAYEKLLNEGDVPDHGGPIDDNEQELQKRVARIWEHRRAAMRKGIWETE